MSSPDVALLGAQVPTHSHYPNRFALTSAGEDAIELAASVGLHLDPWQKFVLDKSLMEKPNGNWATSEVGLIVPRQNGKGSILEARELAGLILFGEKLILHSAHEFKTAAEAFLRVKSLFDNYDHLRRRVRQIRTSHGDEGIELMNGARLRFVARSRGSGRGFSGDVVVLDEAYHLSDLALDALMPTLSARTNPQLWFTSSAPLEDSVVLRRIMRKGREKSDDGAAYFEWSCEPGCDRSDRANWAQSNPALGGRLREEVIERELASMSPDGFERERLGVVDLRVNKAPVLRLWQELADTDSKIVGSCVFAFDIAPDRGRSSLAVAGKRADGIAHVEIVESADDAHWIIPRIKKLAEKWGEVIVCFDDRAGAVSLRSKLEDIPEVTVVALGFREVSTACARIYDACSDAERALRHIEQTSLTAAVEGAITRAVGDSWAWDRRKPEADITPLVAATFAYWAVTEGYADFDIGDQVF